jgi:alkylation response protein AidB-like acyl-CoA dehydrogenase
MRVLHEVAMSAADFPAKTKAPAVTGTPLERIARLSDVIREGGDKAQQLRRLPGETVDALVDAGIFRIAIPRELGGDDASITETIAILEAIARIDGSVGWNVMLGSEINAMAAGGMDRALAREVFQDDPRVIMCGGGGPGSQPARAEKQPSGGYRVWGQTTFISGCHNATWCFMMAPVVENGAVVTDSKGIPAIRTWFLHKSQFEILDTWDVAGLRGSGSHDVRADGVLVSDKWARVQLFQLPAHYPNPAFRVPVALRLAYNKAAVAIGVARGAVDEFYALAQTKVPWLTASALRDRPVAQQRAGEAEAGLRSARAFLMEAMHEVEEELKRGREIPSPQATQTARLACTHAANASMHVVDLVHNTCGTSAMRMHSPLERKLRDAHGCATHRWVAHPLYGELGKILLGHEATPEFLGLQ